MANETRDPVRDFAEDWEATCHVGEEIKRLLKDREDDPEALREILTRFHLCSVGIVDRILEAVTLEDSGPTWTQVSPHLDLVTLLFWLIYDRRLRLGSRHCHDRSEEHTSELQSLMRISYAVFCFKKKQHKECNTS